mgnify:CR=1 FL=1
MHAEIENERRRRITTEEHLTGQLHALAVRCKCNMLHFVVYIMAWRKYLGCWCATVSMLYADRMAGGEADT